MVKKKSPRKKEIICEIKWGKITGQEEKLICETNWIFVIFFLSETNKEIPGQKKFMISSEWKKKCFKYVKHSGRGNSRTQKNDWVKE